METSKTVVPTLDMLVSRDRIKSMTWKVEGRLTTKASNYTRGLGSSGLDAHHGTHGDDRDPSS